MSELNTKTPQEKLTTTETSTPSPHIDLDTHKSRGVVVTGGLGVTVSLKHRVSLHNLLFKTLLLLSGLFLLAFLDGLSGDVSKV